MQTLKGQTIQIIIRQILNCTFLIVSFAIGGCSNHPQNKADLNQFDKQGHRGCRGLMPENTIAGMIHALELGVTTLELDLVVTADKQLLLSHEPFFNHEITTLPDGKLISEEEEKSLNIFKMSYEETQRFDVGLKPHPRFPEQKKLPAKKPLFKDLIDSVQSNCKRNSKTFPYLNIETKSDPATDNTFHPAPAEFVELIMSVVNNYDLKDKVTIQSFDFRTLQYLHAHYPGVSTAALVEDFDKKNLEEHISQLGFTPSVYSPHFSLVTKDLVNSCHAKNIRLIPWTVNDKSKIDSLRQLGVDGIITDYPNLFQ